MEKRVGRIVSIFLLFVSGYILGSESAIALRMQDMNHSSIDQAMCQAPFILQVELKNLEGYTDTHIMRYISGIENFKSSRSMTSHNVSIDNGIKTTKIFYNFVLRADKKGKFTVGPLKLKDKAGQQVQSNRLIITVGDDVLSSEKHEKDKYFMMASLSKKQAYVGEKVTLSIKFYDRLFVDDLHLQLPDFNNLYVVKNHDNVNKSMTLVDGEEYCVTEWIFDTYGKEPGLLILQDINVAFFAPELENKFQFGRAFDFFRSLHKKEQYVSAQPIKIEVMPLPKHDTFRDIEAVGQFLNFTISINQTSASAGQGIVFKIELFGDANFEMMQSDSLVLPEGFKYYDSRMVAIDEKRNHKCCEFIVQANIPGAYHIAPQKLVYFDPVDNQYKTLYSNALDLIITPADKTSGACHVSDVLLDESTEDVALVEKKLKDFLIVQKGAIHRRFSVMIPLVNYQYLLVFLFLMWLLFIIYRAVSLQQYIFDHPVWKKYIIFLRVERAYKIALLKQDVKALYAIFIQLFGQLIDVTSGQLSDEIVIQYFIDKGFSKQQIEAWKNFKEQILQASFSLQAQKSQKDLFEMALEWIQQLKEKA